MEKMNLITLVITLVVGVILAGSLLAPVVEDVTATSDTYTNEGYFYVESPGDSSVTYLFQDNALTINGEAVPLPTGSEYPDGLTIFYTEHICVRYDDGLFKVRGVANHNAYYLNVTVQNGTITGEYQWSSEGVSTINWTYEEFVGMVGQTTDRVMGKSVEHYLNADSYIETTGLTNLTNIGWAVVHISGSITDGITVKLYNQGSGAELTTLTVSNVEIHYTEVANHIDLYKVDRITFDVTDGTNTASATYTIYTLPAQVTADRSNPMPTDQATIMGAIPIMVIVALLMLAVGAIAYRRAD